MTTTEETREHVAETLTIRPGSFNDLLQLSAGDRVELVELADRFPFCVVPAGSRGTVCAVDDVAALESDPSAVALVVALDDNPAELAEWGGELHYTGEDVAHGFKLHRLEADELGAALFWRAAERMGYHGTGGRAWSDPSEAVAALASAFSARVREHAGDRLEALRADAWTLSTSPSCATWDHIGDPNECMIEALERCGLPFWSACAEASDVINAAWSAAKLCGFRL